jgi:hypothetical protein
MSGALTCSPASSRRRRTRRNSRRVILCELACFPGPAVSADPLPPILHLAVQRALALTVVCKVRDAVWEVAFLRNEAQLARKEWETARALRRDVKKRVAAGELAQTDLVLARI